MNQDLSFFTILGIGTALPGIMYSQENEYAKPDVNKPNVVLILADDLGYEALSCNGSLSYQTPVLDELASQGIRFTECHANPLCSPSRLRIMTGQYNYRNYEYFEYMRPSIKTFGNLMQDAGYVTAIAGKWQLNGIRWGYPSALDPSTVNHFGFDDYLMWQLTHTRPEGERYADPLLETNGGKLLEGLEDSYGPDVLVDFLNDFIDRNKDKPFFVYYPMVLTHDPFVTTPDSPDWSTTDDRYHADNAYFKDMVEYMDKNVGKIVDNLKEEGVWENTILLFTGDNGTNVNIVTQTVNGEVKGGKGTSLRTGTHVPLIAVWPNVIQGGRVYDGPISFSDFLPTLADFASVDACTYAPDGFSFMPVIRGSDEPIQSEIFIHYTPEWGRNSDQSNRWVFNSTYKLYQNGDFYNTDEDPLEENPLTSLSPEEQVIYNRFDQIIKEKEQEYPYAWSNASDENPRSMRSLTPGQGAAEQGAEGQAPTGQRPAGQEMAPAEPVLRGE